MKKLAILGSILALVALVAVTVTPAMAKPPVGVPVGWTPFEISPSPQTVYQTDYSFDQYYDLEDNAIVQKIEFTLSDITIDIDGTDGTLSDTTVKTTVVWPLLPGEEYEEGVTGVGVWFITHIGYGHGNFHGTVTIDDESYEASGALSSEIEPPYVYHTFSGTRIRGEETWTDVVLFEEGTIEGGGWIKLLP